MIEYCLIMVRANIYSIEALDPGARGAIREGIDMLAGYIGESVAMKEFYINLKLNQNRDVRPEQVDLSWLDPNVELHMFAVPLDPNYVGGNGRMGWAGVDAGWCYVDTVRYSPDSMRATAAHEIAHTLGFVTKYAQHEDIDSPFHCCNRSCIMHKHEVVTTVFEEAKAVSAQAELDRMLRSSSIRRPVVARSRGQQDFCWPCKNDMSDKGQRNLDRLRRVHGYSTQTIY